MNFYVNPHSADGHGTSSRTTIHRAGCASAERYGQTPKWRGPFETFEEAHACAQTTGYPVNCCRKCNPSAAGS